VLLSRMTAASNLDAATLKATGIGVELNLRAWQQHPDQRVAGAASALIARWRKAVRPQCRSASAPATPPPQPVGARLPQSAPAPAAASAAAAPADSAGLADAEWRALADDIRQRIAAAEARRGAGGAGGVGEEGGGASTGAGGVDADSDDRMIDMVVEDMDNTVDFLSTEVPEVGRRRATELYELLLQLGAAPSAAQMKVCELYSVPRVTAMPGVNVSGLTFDLRGDAYGRRWDFRKASDRKEALEAIRSQKPFLVIGSPPCTPFSVLNTRWNHRRMDPVKVKRQVAEGRMLLGFAVQVYEMQLAAGRHFLHEHPAHASSWTDPILQKLRRHPAVYEATADQCRYGLVSRGADGVLRPARKPTRFLSSAPEVLKELNLRCRGNHRHTPLLNGRAKAAETYPQKLCRAILRGVLAQSQRAGRAPPGVEQATARGVGIYSLSPDEIVAEDFGPAQTHVEDEVDAMAACGPAAGSYWDALTGEALPAGLTSAAREEELDFMDDWAVWDVVPVAECVKRTGKRPLGGKWVDVNKGDTARPDVRSRYVAKEIAFRRSDDFFAATPPLEALRMLLSNVASSKNLRVLVLDARKAHLHSTVNRLLYVELPPERRQPGMCARLRRCLYGTRDAPAQWEAFLADQLRGLGFVQGVSSPCCFYHPVRDIQCVVHGDDFIFAGTDAELDWVKSAMTDKFLIKEVGRLGPGSRHLQELRVLNRVLRWTPRGLRYEADPRHAEILVRGVAEGLRPVATPGAASKGEDGDARAAGAADDELNDDDASLYRSFAARANYLSLDRPDLAYAAKELCRRMQHPRQSDLSALRRLVQYLAGSPRLVYQYEWQDSATLRVFSDTDFAGCRATRKSTSGGCAFRGSHLVKHWSSTQKVVTLSSGEAELTGLVKATCEGLGLQSLAADLGGSLAVTVLADSSAAIGICRRAGLGRVRHLAVSQLWVQGRLRDGAFTLRKVLGTDNPADILTKPVVRQALDKHLAQAHLDRAAGRAATAPEVTAKVRGFAAARAANPGAAHRSDTHVARKPASRDRAGHRGALGAAARQEPAGPRDRGPVHRDQDGRRGARGAATRRELVGPRGRIVGVPRR